MHLVYRFVVANEGSEGFARYKGICTSAHIRSCVGYVLCQVIGYFLPIFCVQGYQEGECITWSLEFNFRDSFQIIYNTGLFVTLVVEVAVVAAK